MLDSWVMAEATKSSILDAADRLASLLQSVPADAQRDKALYHLQRLQLSVSASHSEAVRFAAFTVNKTVHDAETGVLPSPPPWKPFAAELHANGARLLRLRRGRTPCAPTS